MTGPVEKEWCPHCGRLIQAITNEGDYYCDDCKRFVEPLRERQVRVLWQKLQEVDK